MRRKTLNQSVYDEMRRDLVMGAFAPEAALRVDDMKLRYGSSASPLREAMFRLATEGFLDLESQRGFRAAAISRDELLDLTARRVETETRALTLSIEFGGAEWESELVKRHHRFGLTSRQVATGLAPLDEEWESHHRSLHLGLIEGCRSPWLMRFCISLHDHFDRYRRYALLAPRDFASLTLEEDELVSAALRRDEQRAVTLLEHHVIQARDAIAAKLFPSEEARGPSRTAA